MERRFNDGTVTRKDNTISGLTLRFNAPYEIYGEGYYEEIADTAFDEFLNRNHDVVALFNHDVNWILGRVSSGTLKLRKAPEGIYYDINFDAEDSQHRDVKRKIDKGDVRGSSFSFLPAAVEVRSENGKDIVRITRMAAWGDVGPVVNPMNPATTATTRSADNPLDYKAIIETNKRSQLLKNLK